MMTMMMKSEGDEMKRERRQWTPLNHILQSQTLYI